MVPKVLIYMESPSGQKGWSLKNDYIGLGFMWAGYYGLIYVNPIY